MRQSAGRGYIRNISYRYNEMYKEYIFIWGGLAAQNHDP